MELPCICSLWRSLWPPYCRSLQLLEQAHAESDVQITGPQVHDNLAVYFVHGASASGPVPLTLAEAIDKGTVRVIETGEVNELKMNAGADAVFVQSGDIVKGGRQDRTLTIESRFAASFRRDADRIILR